MTLRIIEILAGAILFTAAVRWWRHHRTAPFYQGPIPRDGEELTTDEVVRFAAAVASYCHCAPARDPLKGRDR